MRAVEVIPEAEGWAVWITHAYHGGERCEALERQRGGARVFATLDAVAHALAVAGVARFQVSTDKPP